MFPDTLMIGIEIRKKVSQYAIEKLKYFQGTGIHYNLAFIRSNAMRFLPYYFKKGQLQKIFVMFPDPHFKKRKIKWRILNLNLLDQYAYFLEIGGYLYTITDVEQVYLWILDQFSKHPLFEPLTDQELQSDEIAKNFHNLSDEGKNVEKEGGKTFKAIYKRIEPKVIDS
ncbi:tRNA (guanine-N(7)-)-methyltransferase [Thelohanellus kitauei]|uniref:tRNA (guanine(46)-N(7))-methyltransferase n=1 Tax=Thelohanellus kitauei TaxID=669202 RepID=A0A0C2M0S2_THEKT|nr:tRNA (guanine-N(7)-)-methyltransferase [Thelohanellus kitauei]